MKLYHQSWLTLSTLQLSGILSFPVLMIGFYIGQHYSGHQFVIQLLLGNIMLFGFAIGYALLINNTKMVTIQFAECLLGPRGSVIAAFSMAISLMGWSAIQIHLIQSALGNSFIFSFLIPGCVYFLMRNDLGFLAAINQYILPATLTCLAYFLISKTNLPVLQNDLQFVPFQVGLMLVITAGSGLVFDLPTFFRHAATAKDAYLGLAIIFLIYLPGVESLGVFLSRHATLVGNNNWIQHFIHELNTASIIFLVLSGILGTCLNIYSSSIILNRTLGLSYRTLLLCGCLGAGFLAQINLENKFSAFLEVINLNSEILTVMLFIYVSFKGLSLPLPTRQERKFHLLLFALLLAYAILTKLFPIHLSEDLFLDVAILSGCLMLSYYLPVVIREKRYASNQRK